MLRGCGHARSYEPGAQTRPARHCAAADKLVPHRRRPCAHLPACPHAHMPPTCRSHPRGRSARAFEIWPSSSEACRMLPEASPKWAGFATRSWPNSCARPNLARIGLRLVKVGPASRRIFSSRVVPRSSAYRGIGVGIRDAFLLRPPMWVAGFGCHWCKAWCCGRNGCGAKGNPRARRRRSREPHNNGKVRWEGKLRRAASSAALRSAA